MRIVSLKTKKLISIGIDVGSVNGAISIVSEDGEILLLTKAPIYQTEVKSKRNKSKLNKLSWTTIMIDAFDNIDVLSVEQHNKLETLYNKVMTL